MAPARTAYRALRIFEIFREAGGPLTLSELARQLDIPTSSCHAIVGTLKAMGYVQELNNRQIYPSGRLLVLAQALAERDPLLSRLVPELQWLRDLSQETAILAKRQGDHLVMLAVAESRRPVRHVVETGEIQPLYCGAAGKALLADMTESDRDWLLSRLTLETLTGRTITDPAALQAELETGRKRGYHLAEGERLEDLADVAITVRVAGETLALALTGPLDRLLGAHGDHGRALAQCRDRIANLLDGEAGEPAAR